MCIVICVSLFCSACDISALCFLRSREEIARHQIEQEMILAAGGKKYVVIENWRMHRPRLLSNQPCLRAIWVEQALLLIKQVYISHLVLQYHHM